MSPPTDVPKALDADGASVLRAGRPDEAIAAADLAIAQLLHEGLTVQDFIRLSLRGAPTEALFRYERRAVAHTRRLHEPLALRWEALRRAGRREEARELRSVCIRHFPERASVWATAGNQALDEEDFELAERYFVRCLRLDANWSAALVGRAIVLETRKDWAGALQYRQRVVELSGALERDDQVSVQRAMRYAAALGRSGRWQEASPLFRRCLARGAFEMLPAERPVLFRVFSHELYAPALIARLHLRASPVATSSREVAFALQEAAALAQVYERLERDVALEPAERLELLGMCAWLAGDDARAYALFDEAELDDGESLACQHLLACCAQTIGSPERTSIEGFAVRAARAALASQIAGRETAVFYALLTLARFGGEAPLASAAIANLPPTSGDSLASGVRRIVAFRAAQQAAGRSALDAARSSADAVTQLLTA